MRPTQEYLLPYVMFSLMWGYHKSRYINIAGIFSVPETNLLLWARSISQIKLHLTYFV